MTQKSLLPAGWDIPEELRERLGERPGRQRVMEAEGHLLLVLHAPPKYDEQLRQGRYLWRHPDGQWSAAGVPGGAGALDHALDEYEAAIEQLLREEDAAVGTRDYFELITQLGPLVRSSRNLHLTLDRARQAVRQDRRLILARDRAYELARQVELLYEHSKNILDFEIARRVEQQAESSSDMAIAAHRLNVLVAFFLPIATLMGVFGANLGHGLESWDVATAPTPLILLIGLGLALGLAVTWFVTRRVAERRGERLGVHEANRDARG